jgi:hypothetical protein
MEMSKAGSLAEIREQVTYHSPNQNQILRMQDIRRAGLLFAETIWATTKPGADRSAAIRKVREAVMTANAAIVLEEPTPVAEAPKGENAPEGAGRV